MLLKSERAKIIDLSGQLDDVCKHKEEMSRRLAHAEGVTREYHVLKEEHAKSELAVNIAAAGHKQQGEDVRRCAPFSISGF